MGQGRRTDRSVSALRREVAAPDDIRDRVAAERGHGAWRASGEGPVDERLLHSTDAPPLTVSASRSSPGCRQVGGRTARPFYGVRERADGPGGGREVVRGGGECLAHGAGPAADGEDCRGVVLVERFGLCRYRAAEEHAWHAGAAAGR